MAALHEGRVLAHFCFTGPFGVVTCVHGSGGELDQFSI